MDGRPRDRTADLSPRRRRGGQEPGVGRGALPGLRPAGVSPGPTSSSLSAGEWSPTSPASPPPATTGARCGPRATTLLGQVDAAIGGKTGVNLPEGKNLVGAFWQPAAVLCDIETLETLPPREYRSGLGEMAKYAFLGVDGLRDLPLDEAVAACVACKAAFVGADERETAGGPCSTTATPWPTPSRQSAATTFATGRPSAVGLVFAARLAQRMGRIDAARVDRARPAARPATTCRAGSAGGRRRANC